MLNPKKAVKFDSEISEQTPGIVRKPSMKERKNTQKEIDLKLEKRNRLIKMLGLLAFIIIILSFIGWGAYAANKNKKIDEA